MNTGLCIDGPLFGKNLSATTPVWRVADMPKLHLEPLGHDEPIPYTAFHVTSYVFNPDGSGRAASKGLGVWSTYEGEFIHAWDDWVGDRFDGRVKPGSMAS